MSAGELHPYWTIAELGERVSAALAEVEYEPPINGQVRAVPDLRTIRYYTTLGLLDRPATMKGRTALYRHRHLLQLVAIKRLQADGRSLSEVQAALAGLDDEALAAIARVRAADRAPVRRREAAAPARREARFWAAAPASAASPDSPDSPARPGAHARAVTPPAALSDPAARFSGAAGARSAPPAAASWTAMARLELARGVSLVIETAGPAGQLPRTAASVDPADLARAAGPLLELLRRRGLAGEDREEED